MGKRATGVVALVQRAEALLARGDARGAVGLCDEALASAPGLAAAELVAGRAYESVGFLQTAIDRYERAAALDPTVTHLFAHAAALTAAGERDASVNAWRAASAKAAKRSRDPAERLRVEWAFVESLAGAGLFEEAIERAEATLGDGRLQAVMVGDAPIALRTHLAESRLRARGDADLARAAVDAVLRDPKDEGHALATVALEVRYGGWLGRREASVARLRAELPGAAERVIAAGKPTISIETACKVLGREEEVAGAIEQARRMYELGNAAANGGRASAWSGETHRETVAALLGALGDVGALARSAAAPGRVRPVLIVGLPRSGTSLVEQVLSAHGSVCARGELQSLFNAMTWVGERVGQRPTDGRWLGAVTQDLAEAGGARYLRGHEAAAAGVGGSSVWVTDKLPMNFLNLHGVWQMLPGAKVVWCLREPADAVFSCWSTAFAADLPFSRDLELMRAYLREHDRCLAFWRDAGLLDVHVVRYESMVSDLERESRALVEFLGLDWEDGVLRYHESARRVLTASSEQATKPIFDSSVGRGARFGVEA